MQQTSNTMILALTALAFLACGTANAADDQINIQGSVSQFGAVGVSVNLAKGKNAKAHTSVAAIRGGVTVKGDVEQTALIGNINNLATGAHAKASTNIATVGRNVSVNGNVTQRVAIASVATWARTGDTARTDIATIRDNANIAGSIRQTVVLPAVVNPGGCVSIGSVGPDAGCK